MKRVFKCLLVAGATLVLLVVVLLWLIFRGAMPLQDGVQLADGNVIAVVDDSHQPFPVVAYLFRLQDGDFGLVDAGNDPTAVAILAALARLGENRDSVRAIFFTHGHGDHTRGRRAFPNADTYRPERVDLSQGSRPARSLLQRLRSFSSPQRRSIQEQISVTRRVSDGELLDIGGTEVEVFALPGHTPDSAALLAHGVLFLGDSAAATYKGTLVSAPPVVSVDRDRNKRELKRLSARLRSRRNEIRWLAFGHQGPLLGIEPLLEWAEALQ